MALALEAKDLPRAVQKIFEERCYRCHGDESKGGLRLDRPEAWEDDVPERILMMVSGKGREMMPPEGKLPKSELSILKKWIAKGTKR